MRFGEILNLSIDERVHYLIWLATTWNIWKFRNNVIFNGTLPVVSTLLDDIKVSSWIWFSNRVGRKSCMDPLACFIIT
jgi:hypothetical protein